MRANVLGDLRDSPPFGANRAKGTIIRATASHVREERILQTTLGALSILSIVTVACVVTCFMTAEWKTVHQTYHPNGHLSAEWCTDAKGLRHGEERYWDEHGRLCTLYEWSHGEPVTHRVFDHPGSGVD